MDRDFDVDSFLQRPLFAHLSTMSDAGPRESPVWFLWEAGALWFVGSHRDSFPKRVRREPRCAVGIVEFDLPRGILRHVGMRGNGAVEELDRARLRRLLSRYLGLDEAAWNPHFRARVIDRLDLMVRFKPVSVVARDQSYFSNAPLDPSPARDEEE